MDWLVAVAVGADAISLLFLDSIIKKRYFVLSGNHAVISSV